MAETKLFLSARITEKFFSKEEIKEIKKELKNCSKSKFIRQAIKTYLKTETKISTLSKTTKNNQNQNLEAIKSLIEKNHSLLREIKNNNLEETATSQTKDNQPNSNTYQGKEQEAKIDEALNLLDQF